MEKLEINRLVEVCRKHGARKIMLFGSFVRGDAGPESDIDLIVEFLRPTGFLALVKLERELSEAMGRKVDLLTEKAISPHLRDRIQDEQQVIYEAAG